MKTEIISSLAKRLSCEIGCFQVGKNLGCRFSKIHERTNERKKEALAELLKESPDLRKLDHMLSNIHAIEKLIIYHN